MQDHESGQAATAVATAAGLLHEPTPALREAWVSQLRVLAPDRGLPRDVMERHFDEVCRHVAAQLERDDARPWPDAERAARLAEGRLAGGFDLDLLVVEYAALRAAVASVSSGIPADTRGAEPEWIEVAVARAIAELAVAASAHRRAAGAAGEPRPESVIDELPIGVLVVDREGVVKLANRAISEVLGADTVRPGTRVPPPGLEVLDDQGNPIAPERLPVLRALWFGEPVAGEQVRVVRGSRTITLRVNAAPLRDEADVTVGAVSVFDDVTSTRLLYEASQREVKVREQLISIVSHDLRNLLTPVLVGAQVLSRIEGMDTLERRVRRTAEGIQRSCERMTRLIDDLVDWGTIQAGKLAVSVAPGDAEELLRESIELFRPVALERGIELGLEAPPDLGEVVCDRDRVLQALSNLLSNALKVVGEGGRVIVGAERRPGELLVKVADTGPGIAAASLEHLFERYWRGNEPGYKGTGLGLAITKGIVDAHGGRIWADSTQGVGSTFHFTLPDRVPPGPGERG